MAFDPKAYLAANRDVAESGMDPWTHYQLYGQAEGRSLGTDLPMSRSNPSAVNFVPGAGGLSNDLWALLGGKPGANPTQPVSMGGTGQAPVQLSHRAAPSSQPMVNALRNPSQPAPSNNALVPPPPSSAGNTNQARFGLGFGMPSQYQASTNRTMTPQPVFGASTNRQRTNNPGGLFAGFSG
jgi:hypothetical protein